VTLTSPGPRGFPSFTITLGRAGQGREGERTNFIEIEKGRARVPLYKDKEGQGKVSKSHISLFIEFTSKLKNTYPI
jgi:hypothetical protein